MLRHVTMAALLLACLIAVVLHTHHNAEASPKPALLTATHPMGGPTINAPLVAPPPWMPLQASEPTLTKLATMGDRSAAERLFVEARRCLKARRLKAFFKGKNYETWAADNRQYLEAKDSASRDRIMAGVKANIALVNTYDRLCGDTDAILADGQFYQIAFAAARLGDDDATACILSGFYDPPKMTPMQAAAFDDEAMELGRRALTHGHWNTVLALETVYGVSGIEGQTGPVSHLNAADYLRVLNLQWRGTPRGTPESSALAQQIQAVEARVTPAEKFAAERWADETYAQSFSASGPVTNADTGGCDW